MIDKKNYASGFVSLIGKPNVGKSTLLNALIGVKLAPVARKPQTTRETLHGILTGNSFQIIFIDTPGIHEPKDELGSRMVRGSHKAMSEADLVYFMVDPVLPDPESDVIFKNSIPRDKPVFLLINKIDQIKDKQEILPVMEYYANQFSFTEVIPISAEKKMQLDILTNKTRQHLPKGARLFPDDMLSDRPVRDIIKEFIREKIVRLTSKELPYATAVEIESFQEKKNSLVAIEAVIYVERDTQKAIIIGNKGDKIREIGTSARIEIERFIEKKVFLRLWVKVAKGWTNDPSHLRQMGYED